MPGLQPSQIAFTCALVERMLREESLNTASVELVRQGMQVGREQSIRPPNPMQQPQRYYPGLLAQPWYSAESFEFTSRVESSFDLVRKELLQIWDTDSFTINPLSEDFALAGKWTEFRLFTKGRKFIDHCALCPETTKLIESIVGASTAGSVYFAVLDPHTHLRPHWGPHNARIRCHLGLIVPPGCAIRVGEESRPWVEGKVLIFDDSFEHEVWNPSEKSRVVLIFDIWHPQLSASDIAAIRYSDVRFVELAYEVARNWAECGRFA